MLLLGALVFAACVPTGLRAMPYRNLPAVAVGASDGDVWVRDGPVHLALLGHAARAPAPLLASLAEEPAQLVVLAGDAVPRSRRPAWEALRERVEGLRALPVPGRGERLGDRRLGRYLAIWSGIGVAGLSEPVPWYAVDVETRGTRWRLVVLDAHRDPLGERWLDQLFWVPKVVGADDYDHLVVAVAGPDEGPLLDVVRQHADATRLWMVVRGGRDAPAMILPGGRWGEAWIHTGRPTLPAAPLAQRQGAQRVWPAYVDALVDVFEARTDRELEGLRESASLSPPRAPVAGFWSLTLEGDHAALTLRLADGTAEWEPGFRAQWTPRSGWRRDPPAR